MYSSPAVVDGVVYVGSKDNNVYAIDAATGSERWRFATGSDVYSSPAVVDGVVYVGSWDESVYAIDAATGSERWRFATGSYVRSSPAVVDGVAYVGSYDGSVYAIGYSETEVQASYATATAIAIATATHEALVAARQTYYGDIAFNLEWLAANSPDFPRGLVIGNAQRLDQPFVGRGWSYGAWFPAGFSVADTAGSGVAALVYDDGAAAGAEVAATIDGLVRTGWQRTETDRIDGDHTCLTYTGAAGVEALCFAQRDRVVIIGASALPTNAPEAVLMNAADLTQMGLLATRDLVLPE